MIQKIIVVLGVVFCGQGLLADTTSPQPADANKTNVKYKKTGDVNFEELLIQGQLKRPEITVVTGNTDQGSDGLLRLRESFMDRIAVDHGEEIQ